MRLSLAIQFFDEAVASGYLLPTLPGKFLKAISLVCLFSLQLACSSYPKYPVAVDFLDEKIDTTVDSEVAQYYLQHYIQGKKENPGFDQRIDKVYQMQITDLPDRQTLKQLSRQFSPDFAAIFLASRLWDDPSNRDVQHRFQWYLKQTKEELFSPQDVYHDYLVLFVPGWNYVDNGSVTGSDFAAPRKLIDSMGVENYLVNIPSTGSIFQSAEVLAKDIERYSGNGRKIIVVGASAAGPSIHYVLGKHLNHRQLSSVVGWVNLGGILQGSPLIDYFQEWPQKILLNAVLWYKDWDNEEILTMSAQRSRKRFNELSIPEHIVVMNYLGLSLSGDLTHLSSYKYPFIVEHGPNDGLTLLVDIIAPHSQTLIATKSDHYFGEDPHIGDKAAAILKTVIDLIESRKSAAKIFN